ncbi:MAG: hypothetical protein IKX22_10310 [Prevotella sp.]|nr:hypothetical protein [Prevotella sp.]
MKKIFTTLMVFAMISGWLACDNETSRNLARTDYVFYLNMNEEAHDVLEFTWDSKGSSPSMQSFSSHDTGYTTIPDDDGLFSEGGHLFKGTFPSFIIAEVGCHLKSDISEMEKKDSYELSAGLLCTVTTRDALGLQLRVERVECTNAFHCLTLTYDQLLETFGNSDKPYVLRIGIDVDNGNSIQIFQDNEEEYGTIIKTKG